MRRILIVLAIVPLMVHAQETDVVDYVSDNEGGRTVSQVWTEVGVTKVLPHNLSLGFDVGFRTEDWFKDASRFDIGVSLNWKASKHWKFGVGYTFINKHYISEIERKQINTTETKYKYTSTDAAGVETDWVPDPTELHGIPYYTVDGAPYDGTNAVLTDAGDKYTYQGYNDIFKDKDYVRVTESFWRAKHRFSADAAYSTSRLGGWLRLSLRERYQVTYMPEKNVLRTRTKTTTKNTYRYRIPSYDYTDDGDLFIDSYSNVPGNWVSLTHPDNPETSVTTEVEETSKDKRSKWLHVLRSRLTLEVDKKGWKWTPFLYVESFNNMGDGWHFDKLRASAGVDYALSKQHKIGFGYIFNHENDDDGDENIHAINVSYKFKF